MEETFEIDSCIRGYHVYKEVWTSNGDAILSCRREVGNIHDPYAISMVNESGIVVGHVPRKISAVCSLYLLRGGSINCKVTGSRRYSSDLPQGGLELPCHLIFTGSSTMIKKIESLLLQAPASQSNNPEQPPKKKIKLEKSDDGSDAHVWITYLNDTLLFADKEL